MDCACCGYEIGSNLVGGRPIVGRYRCATCRSTVCLDCHVFDVDGKRACWTCVRSGRAVTAASPEVR